MKNFSLLLGAAVLSLLSSRSTAATLTSVPMQGGMVMPMVSYNSGDGALHVMLAATVPQLTPLLVSNPGDSFDPGDPWYDSVDPSRQGQSFSRRFGFMMDMMSDPLPANTQLWLRKLNGSAAVSAYRYQDTAPKAWEPIFGTAGTTNALRWNMVMFHPAFTAPCGTNSYSATFEAYLLDASTGTEVAGSSSGPFVFNWTNVPDGRPELTLASKIVLGWPSSTATNWVLESASSPTSATWSPVTNAPVMLEGQPAVVLEGSAAQNYFRMRYLP